MTRIRVVLECSIEYLDAIVGAVKKDRNIRFVSALPIANGEETHRHKTIERRRSPNGKPAWLNLLDAFKEHKTLTKGDIKDLVTQYGGNSNSVAPRISDLVTAGLIEKTDNEEGDTFSLTKRGEQFKGTDLTSAHK